MAWNALGNWLTRLNPLRWEREFTEYFAADEVAEEELEAGVEAVEVSPLFRQLALDCRHFGGYGCNDSVLWLLGATTAEVVVADSAGPRLEQFAGKSDAEATSAAAARVRLVPVDWTDFGPRSRLPATEQQQRVGDYLAAPWKFRLGQPDLLLIAGRFRVACFLYALLQAEPGTRILFDGYREQVKYHVAEEFCPVAQWSGEQALFIVPEQVDRPSVEAALLRYSAAID